jgi:hypothetical protein
MPKIPDGATQVALDGASRPMLLDGVDLRGIRRTAWAPTAKSA